MKIQFYKNLLLLDFQSENIKLGDCTLMGGVHCNQCIILHHSVISMWSWQSPFIWLRIILNDVNCQLRLHPTRDSRGYFLATKRATKGVAKRREKQKELQSGEKKLWYRLLTLLNMPPQSSCTFHFQSQFLTLEISLVNRQTVFYKDCHWLSWGGRSNRFFTGVIQEDYERDSGDCDTIITNSWLADLG